MDRSGDITSRYVSDYLWLTWGGRVGHAALPEGDERLVQQTVLSSTRTSENRAGSQHDDRTLMGTVNDDRHFTALTMRQDWTLLQSARAVLRWGGELSQEEAAYQYASSVLRDSVGPRQSNGVRPRLDYVANSNIVTRPTGVHSGAYVTERLRPVQSFTVEGGLRYDAHTSVNDEAIEPRLNVVWDVKPNTALRGAWGRMAQSQSLGSVHVEDGDSTPFAAKRSEYAIIGVDHMLDRDLLARVEVYRRKQSEMWAYGISNADGDVEPPTP